MWLREKSWCAWSKKDCGLEPYQKDQQNNPLYCNWALFAVLKSIWRQLTVGHWRERRRVHRHTYGMGVRTVVIFVYIISQINGKLLIILSTVENKDSVRCLKFRFSPSSRKPPEMLPNYREFHASSPHEVLHNDFSCKCFHQIERVGENIWSSQPGRLIFSSHLRRAS